MWQETAKSSSFDKERETLLAEISSLKSAVNQPNQSMTSDEENPKVNWLGIILFDQYRPVSGVVTPNLTLIIWFKIIIVLISWDYPERRLLAMLTEIKIYEKHQHPSSKICDLCCCYVLAEKNYVDLTFL